MARNNQNPPPYQPWLVSDAVVVLRKVHDMVKHSEKLFPNFNPNKKDYVEYHVTKLLLAVQLQNVQHE
jgi:hypothetical protein